MSVVDAFVLACSTNVDNLAVGLAFGSRADRVQFGSGANAIVAALSFLSTLVSVWMGQELLRFVPSPHWLRRGAGVALFGVALVLLYTSVVNVRRKRDGNSAGDGDGDGDGDDDELVRLQPPGRVSARDAVGIGLALTLTNLGTGIVGGLHELNPLVAAAMSALTSFAAIAAGLCAGRAAAARTASALPAVLSATLLAVFAIRVLIE